jgi:hypothetical protein
MGSFVCSKATNGSHCALMNASIAIFTEKLSLSRVFFGQNIIKKSPLFAQKKHVTSWLSHFCFNKNTLTSK